MIFLPSVLALLPVGIHWVEIYRLSCHWMVEVRGMSSDKSLHPRRLRFPLVPSYQGMPFGVECVQAAEMYRSPFCTILLVIVEYVLLYGVHLSIKMSI